MFLSWSRNDKSCKSTTNQIFVENKPLVKKVKTVINVEDTKTLCDEFSEELQHMYFDGSGDESDNSESSNTSFVT